MTLSSSRYYDIDGNPLTFDQFIESFEADRSVGKDEVVTDAGVVLVSTVHLVIDHNFTGRGKPVIFETMLFVDANEDSRLHNACRRYSTLAEALEGHTSTVAALRMAKLPDWIA